MNSALVHREDDRRRLVHHNLAMRRLVQAVSDLSHSRSLETIMQIVRHAAREITGSDGATFILREGENCYYADEEAIAPLWKGQRFPLTACISGWCMLNRMSAVIDDIYADPRVPAHAYRPTFVKSLLMVPIRSSLPVGAIGTYWANRHEATSEEIEVMQALAGTTAVAMQNVQLYSDLEHRVDLRTQQLEVANRELEAFSYSVSHDLRGPLTVIDGYSSLLELAPGAKVTEKEVEYLHNIRNASHEMSVMMSDFLRLARVTRAELKIERVDLTAMAEGIVTRLRGLEPRRKVETVIARDLVAFGDRALLQLAIQNLLGNAWKYTSKTEGARIEFGAITQIDRSQILFVRDNGAGFDMKKAKKLFVPFQRFHTEDEFRGHGVGLATVQRVIQRHGGRVWAEASRNHGATFYFTLNTSG